MIWKWSESVLRKNTEYKEKKKNRVHKTRKNSNKFSSQSINHYVNITDAFKKSLSKKYIITLNWEKLQYLISFRYYYT